MKCKLISVTTNIDLLIDSLKKQINDNWYKDKSFFQLPFIVTNLIILDSIRKF